jgi:hypothetical protein
MCTRQSGRCLMLALLCLCATAAKSAPQQFWILNESTLNPSPFMGDPATLVCDHWTMLLFSDGSLPVFGQQWGAIDGASASDVERIWEQTRSANARANAFLHIYGPQTMGYDAHLGPVCVVKTPRPSQKEALETADGLFNKILSLTYDKLSQLNRLKGFLSPSDAQYLSNLNLIRQRVNSIRNWLNANSRANLPPILAALHDADVALKNLPPQNAEAAHVGAKPTPHTKSASSPGQSWNGRLITNAVGQPEGVSILSPSSIRFVYSEEGLMGSAAPQSVRSDVELAWVNRVIVEDRHVTVAANRTLQSQLLAGGPPSDASYYVRILFGSAQDAQSFAAWVRAHSSVQ